eukprot:443017-Rhodomonas_salina.4
MAAILKAVQSTSTRPVHAARGCCDSGFTSNELHRPKCFARQRLILQARRARVGWRSDRRVERREKKM